MEKEKFAAWSNFVLLGLFALVVSLWVVVLLWFMFWSSTQFEERYLTLTNVSLSLGLVAGGIIGLLGVTSIVISLTYADQNRHWGIGLSNGLPGSLAAIAGSGVVALCLYLHSEGQRDFIYSVGISNEPVQYQPAPAAPVEPSVSPTQPSLIQ
jgi:hypothetical protein